MARLKVSLLGFLMLLLHAAPHAEAGCAEVDSMTEAVVGESFLLGCISCKKREEVDASTYVDWFFRPIEEEGFVQIFHYENPFPTILHEDFEGRLEWHGTKGTRDVQIGAIFIHNVTFNDTGTFRCTMERTLFLPYGEEHVTIIKDVELSVVAVANRELTAVIAEIMMYVVIVVLQLWMILVLIYCYKKIYAEAEAREARRALKAQNKGLDAKDTCDGVHLE
ncbi:sodium channel subunit beta-1 isoform X1 [Alosa sapidissima]|uniref:sodium channel subunit beta-1 isoform X1 n=2 Tax=Alosa sapidissima TaxID=34773 RepID=UPI001C09F4BE|nr:sodium channel subunit beta-1 isoform X1 [Alosa sapidissima]